MASAGRSRPRDERENRKKLSQCQLDDRRRRKVFENVS
jgi:hypothetical protein